MVSEDITFNEMGFQTLLKVGMLELFSIQNRLTVVSFTVLVLEAV